jgi:hypothetical protein
MSKCVTISVMQYWCRVDKYICGCGKRLVTIPASILRARREKPFAAIVSVSKEDAAKLESLIAECVAECATIMEKSDGPEIVAISLVHTSLTEGLI